MHAVVPREGNGKIHYPSALAIAPDAGIAVVIEPFERRLQTFVPTEPQSATGASMPALGGVQNHFGAGVAVDGDLLLLHEPETASVFVFDLRGEIPVHVSNFGGTGSAVDRFGRVVALGVDASTQRIVVIDAGNRRLSVFWLDRDREATLIMDPFMPRLARSWTLEAWSAAVANLLDGRPLLLAPSAIAKAPNGWWIYDERQGVLVRTDARLTPVEAIRTDIGGGTGLAALTSGFAIAVPSIGAVEILDSQGQRTNTIRGDVRAPLLRPASVARCSDGALVMTDAATDQLVFWRDGVLAPFSARGVSDGNLWQPDGVTSLGAGRVVVVDCGNHRAQVFRDDGSWVMTFGLGRANTKPRDGGES